MQRNNNNNNGFHLLNLTSARLDNAVKYLESLFLGTYVEFGFIPLRAVGVLKNKL